MNTNVIYIHIKMLQYPKYLLLSFSNVFIPFKGYRKIDIMYMLNLRPRLFGLASLHYNKILIYV